ncbi:hypothetical protein [Bradyrhizobium yuanmingense]|uniref:hypothetical protein n=1 Tax=Bradyrhizobium yuanmingense TaxID=108015 RepID=UPI0035155353
MLLVPLLPIFLIGMFPMFLIALLGFFGLALFGVLVICVGLASSNEAHDTFNHDVIVHGYARGSERAGAGLRHASRSAARPAAGGRGRGHGRRGGNRPLLRRLICVARRHRPANSPVALSSEVQARQARPTTPRPRGNTHRGDA